MIYYIIGIRRSGLHAIANWLFPMMGEYIYLNNYELGKLTDIEMVINGNFNVIIGIENKPVHEILKYCNKGKRIWVNRDIRDVVKSQRKWYKERISMRESDLKIAIARSLHMDYLEYFFQERETVVTYEKWNDDENYRKELAERLGIYFNDSNKEKVFGYGVSSYKNS